MLLLSAVIAALLILVFINKPLRRQLVTRHLFSLFTSILPTMSQTEKQAVEAGTVWWEGELFQGNPQWKKLLNFKRKGLSAEEQSFIDNELQTLLGMLDDFDIVQQRKDLPEAVWAYLKAKGFFALIIPKAHGGREFSALANSTIVSAIAAKSVSTAVTVMVPNSLGPGELLQHYGTEEQKKYWLPRLASGEEVPCFALTGPEAGSDAGAIPDTGVVCHQEVDGRKVLGIRVSWDKRYITLAPVATVLGLAFKLRDPDKLLSDNPSPGITCALIPVSHPGVETGARHNPVGLAFMNGTTTGKDVFIPVSWIIGGPEYAGKGWRMLIECLSAGRGISLPALATGNANCCLRNTTAYASVRAQFGMPISQFEGIQEALGKIAVNSYQIEAVRTLTAGAIDAGEKPSVVTAIAKYHLTEKSRAIIDYAMDVHGGKGIQLGPKNYLGHQYLGIPVTITVEGANILTRNLMIFGQGATRCHPYVFDEIQAAFNTDKEAGLVAFDNVIWKHIGFTLKTAGRMFWHHITPLSFTGAPVSGAMAKHYRKLSRYSTKLAFCADYSMLVLGGELKRREMLSARFGDVLSELYIASAVLKKFEEDGRPQQDQQLVHYALELASANIDVAFKSALQVFPKAVAGKLLKVLTFPFGLGMSLADDKRLAVIADDLCKHGNHRDKHTSLAIAQDMSQPCYSVEKAFQAKHEITTLVPQFNDFARQHRKKLGLAQIISLALEQGVINASEAGLLEQAEALRFDAISVDTF